MGIKDEGCVPWPWYLRWMIVARVDDARVRPPKVLWQRRWQFDSEVHLPRYELLIPVGRASLLYHEHAPDGFQVSFFACLGFLDAWLELDSSCHMSWWRQCWRRRCSNGWITWDDLRLLLKEACMLRLLFLKRRIDDAN